jgi:predicted glycogen debranching enzyme
MKFIYGKNDWSTFDRGQENCYLLTNGLGGYSSMTMIGSNTRNDHALFMACTKAPNHRYHLITRMDEYVKISSKEKISISSQEYVNRTKNQTGYCLLNQFKYESIPIWTYQVEGIEITKMIVMAHGSNTMGIRYQIDNRMSQEIKLIVTPQLQFVPKGESITPGQRFKVSKDCIESNGIVVYHTSNANLMTYETDFINDLYYGHDARDGRDCIGKVAYNHSFTLSVPAFSEEVCEIIYSTENSKVTFEDLVKAELKRHESLLNQSQIQNKIGKQLVLSADQYIVNRESTKGKSIMAGYPFFADWGRDTMIAMVGCCIQTKRYEDAKSIFRTFMQYCKNGLMPNMFPEGGNDPLYNTVDASLLFIGAVYEYYLESEDLSFVKEAFPVMEDIIRWYIKGTDYHIKMDNDGLIMAGNGLEQVTWMDVRFGDILPTPRHGKPVEINAYWYNDLSIMGYFAKLFHKESVEYESLAEHIKSSFVKHFWNEKENCLKDLVSGEAADEQIRCNQIWAVSQPFSILSREKELMVVNKVFETLYTPYGLRSLSKEDKDFKPKYGGSHFNRDMAYHQGTVWAFPLGGYYLAYLKVHDYSIEAALKVQDQLSVLEACMREGCIGQIAEIYDGENPTISQGCFAQAWSVSELLRVYGKLENIL